MKKLLNKRGSKYLLILATVILGLFAVACSPGPSVVEFSNNIGATFPNAQIKYESFVPALSRDRAIAIARNSLQDGYHLKAENYPVNATIALYTGPFMGPGGGTLTDAQVWIVVIKGLPFSDTGPPDPRPFTSVSQVNYAIDAKTGIIIHEVLSGRRIYSN